MRASLVILVICTYQGVRGWTGLEDEGSGEFAATEAANGETVVIGDVVTEEGFVMDNANGAPPPPEPTPMDFIDPADFLGPQVFCYL